MLFGQDSALNIPEDMSQAPSVTLTISTNLAMSVLIQQQVSADQLMEIIRQTKTQPKPEKSEKFSGAVQSMTKIYNWVTKTEWYLMLLEIKSELCVIYTVQFLTGTAQT